MNGTALLQSLITSCWLYTWEMTNSSNKFAADLNMNGIRFFDSHCTIMSRLMHANVLLKTGMWSGKSVPGDLVPQID